ncbi:hypothetical protein ACHAXA_006688 [Cyclostephanos tholiformis]|uniref:Derlin n=1 Tax=Cyclostephanos tholiformis TaxID=382380 RepID=A0ABD3RM15_9STRA
MDNPFGGIGGEGGGVGVGPAQFLRDLPPVSRILLASTLVCTALVNLDVLKCEDLDFRGWEDVFVGRDGSGRVEAWRLLTCFLYAGKFGWNVLIGLHLMNQISTRYETMGPICTRRRTRAPPPPPPPPRLRRPPPPPPVGEGHGPTPVEEEDGEEEEELPHHSPYHSRGDASDYAFALLLGMVGILLTQTLLMPKLPTAISNDGGRHTFFHRHLAFYVVYVWSKQHSDHTGCSSVSGGTRTLLHTPNALVDACEWLGGRRVGPLPPGGGGEVDDYITMGNGRGERPALADVDGVIGG